MLFISQEQSAKFLKTTAACVLNRRREDGFFTLKVCERFVGYAGSLEFTLKVCKPRP